MMEFESSACPVCGGSLSIDNQEGFLFCTGCGKILAKEKHVPTPYTLEELIEMGDKAIDGDDENTLKNVVQMMSSEYDNRLALYYLGFLTTMNGRMDMTFDVWGLVIAFSDDRDEVRTIFPKMIEFTGRHIVEASMNGKMLDLCDAELVSYAYMDKIDPEKDSWDSLPYFAEEVAKESINGSLKIDDAKFLNALMGNLSQFYIQMIRNDTDLVKVILFCENAIGTGRGFEKRCTGRDGSKMNIKGELEFFDYLRDSVKERTSGMSDDELAELEEYWFTRDDDEPFPGDILDEAYHSHLEYSMAPILKRYKIRNKWKMLVKRYLDSMIGISGQH